MIKPKPPESLANDKHSNGRAQSSEASIEVGVAPVDLYHIDVALARSEKTLIIRGVHFPATALVLVLAMPVY